MPKIFIANRGSHDFEPAKRFGELVFITEGDLNKFAIGNIYRTFASVLALATPEDFFLPTSLPILSAIGTGILVNKFGVVKYLLFRGGQYIVRTIDFRND